MPKLSNDTLLSFLMRASHNNGSKPWRKLSIRLQQYLCGKACRALQYLHTVDKIAHGDLKPENIMFGEDLSLQLIDLGQAAPMGTIILRRLIATPGYRAPEVSA